MADPPPRARITALAALLAASLVVPSLAACDPTTTARPNGTTMNYGALRSDREPIENRFPKLGTFLDLHWMGWLLTDPRVPGPNADEIQALVRLQPGELAAARDGYEWSTAPADFSAQCRPELREFLPSGGDWRRSEKYEADLVAPRYNGRVYLDLASGTVYLDVISG